MQKLPEVDEFALMMAYAGNVLDQWMETGGMDPIKRIENVDFSIEFTPGDECWLVLEDRFPARCLVKEVVATTLLDEAGTHKSLLTYVKRCSDGQVFCVDDHSRLVSLDAAEIIANHHIEKEFGPSPE